MESHDTIRVQPDSDQPRSGERLKYTEQGLLDILNKDLPLEQQWSPSDLMALIPLWDHVPYDHPLEQMIDRLSPEQRNAVINYSDSLKADHDLKQAA